MMIELLLLLLLILKGALYHGSVVFLRRTACHTSLEVSVLSDGPTCMIDALQMCSSNQVFVRKVIDMLPGDPLLFIDINDPDGHVHVIEVIVYWRLIVPLLRQAEGAAAGQVIGPHGQFRPLLIFKRVHVFLILI